MIILQNDNKLHIDFISVFRHVSKKPKGNKISGPKLLEQYVAIADYKAEGKGEISLRQGVSVEVAEKTETGDIVKIQSGGLYFRHINVALLIMNNVWVLK